MTCKDRAKFTELEADKARMQEVYTAHIRRLREDRKVKQMDIFFIGLAAMMGGAGIAFVIYAAAMFGHWLAFGY